MALAAGTRLGPYEITAPLGAGGMGEVYRARDSRLKRDVALKVLPDQLAADPERRARFQREAEILAGLTHPNIAALYGLEDIPSLDSRPTSTGALVMELVEGETLSERIAKGPVPPEEALALSQQIADALDYAHEHGVLHRDLKPANIKVTAEGQVKLLDFGLAKAIESGSGSRESGVGNALANSPTITSPAATRAGTLLGTAAYMAPEQVRGRRRRQAGRHLGVRLRAVRAAHGHARLRGRHGVGHARRRVEERARLVAAARGDASPGAPVAAALPAA